MTPERFYTALLTLYPKAFRDTYGGDVLAAFHELRRTNRRPPLVFWRFVLGDLVRSVCHEQIDECMRGQRRYVLQWLAVCALGIIGTGLASSLVTRGFEYLYHPYLEGLQFAPWSYGALLGAGLGLAQTAVLRSRVRAGLVWVITSAASTAIGFHLAALVAGAIGPVGCGMTIGAIVGGCQWMLARTRMRRPAWPVMATAASLPIAILLCDSLIQRALAGMNPVAIDARARTIAGAQYGAAISVLVRGLQQPHGWADVAFEFAAMAVSGLTIGAITARQLAGGYRANQAGR
jgi:hypothetical protein